MWTCNRLDLQTLGFQPIMPKTLPDDHWCKWEPGARLGCWHGERGLGTLGTSLGKDLVVSAVDFGGPNPSVSESTWFCVVASPYVFINSSETILNYWMMVERYSNLKEEVGGSVPGWSPVYLTEYLPGGQLSPMLWRWHVGMLAFCLKKTKK